jgi:hypothetical protein
MHDHMVVMTADDAAKPFALPLLQHTTFNSYLIVYKHTCHSKAVSGREHKTCRTIRQTLLWHHAASGARA